MIEPLRLDPEAFPTPCYVCDLRRLEENLGVLAGVHDRTGARVLLALKGFALFSTFTLCARYLQGTAASSLCEARLGAEEFGGELHVYAPAYPPEEFSGLLELADHISFNSITEWRRFRPRVESSTRSVQCGLRINPQCSVAPVELYDPCARYSRLGVTRDHVREDDLDGLTGLHLHCLCGQGADALEEVLRSFEDRFADLLARAEWLNLGGGHHITRADYDLDRLCRLIDGLRERWSVEVYLEPGEAIGLETGVLIATVLDIVENEKTIAILDTSATAHMPDVMEMPYRPEVLGAGESGVLQHTYRLAGLTCLAGDVIGDYSFREPLQPGTKIVFLDMIHYTMVKNTTFNGIRLPSIALLDGGDIRIIREFGYSDYRSRLS